MSATASTMLAHVSKELKAAFRPFDPERMSNQRISRLMAENYNDIVLFDFGNVDTISSDEHECFSAYGRDLIAHSKFTLPYDAVAYCIERGGARIDSTIDGEAATTEISRQLCIGFLPPAAKPRAPASPPPSLRAVGRPEPTRSPVLTVLWATVVNGRVLAFIGNVLLRQPRLSIVRNPGLEAEQILGPPHVVRTWETPNSRMRRLS
jgi:hypothetical protein